MNCCVNVRLRNTALGLFEPRSAKDAQRAARCKPPGVLENSPVDYPMESWHTPVGSQMKKLKSKTDVPHGALGLMVLKTLDVLGPMHGYAIGRRIEQISGELLAVNQGTLYPVLLRLEQEGAIKSEWGTSDNNRRARFYSLARGGRKLLEVETQDWEQTTTILSRFFQLKAEDLP